MNRVDIDSVLNQMRALQAEAQSGVNKPEMPGQKTEEFAEILQSSVNTVNESQQQAASMAQAFERGEPGVDLPEVMVALQKARGLSRL